MKIKTLLLALLITTPVLAGTKIETKDLTFANTQTWGEHEAWFLKTWTPKYVGLKAFKSMLGDFPEPPALGSDAAKREIRYLLSLQNLRSKATEAVIEREKHVCGFWLDRYRLGLNTKLDSLILDAYFDSRLWGFAGKKYYNRVRPSFVSTKLKPSIDNPPHPAYPSNHTFQAIIMARILGEVFPASAHGFLESALNIARNREIAGVHYPSDTEASIVLADRFLSELWAVKTFQNALAEVKKTASSSQWRKRSDQADYEKCLKDTREWAQKNGVFKPGY